MLPAMYATRVFLITKTCLNLKVVHFGLFVCFGDVVHFVFERGLCMHMYVYVLAVNDKPHAAESNRRRQ